MARIPVTPAALDDMACARVFDPDSMGLTLETLTSRKPCTFRSVRPTSRWSLPPATDFRDCRGLHALGGSTWSRAESGDEVILTRHGHAVVRLVAVHALLDQKSRKALLREVRSAVAGKAPGGPTAARSQDFLYDDGLAG